MTPLLKRLEEIERRLNKCPKCGRDEYTAAPWLDMNEVRSVCRALRVAVEGLQNYADHAITPCPEPAQDALAAIEKELEAKGEGR